MRENAFAQVAEMLNSGTFSPAMANSRLHMLSKTGKPQATLDDIRPLMIESHWMKLAEKTILLKMEELQSNLLMTASY